jgi:hypothetical protein
LDPENPVVGPALPLEKIVGALTSGRAFCPRSLDRPPVSVLLKAIGNEGPSQCVVGFAPPKPCGASSWTEPSGERNRQQSKQVEVQTHRARVAAKAVASPSAPCRI